MKNRHLIFLTSLMILTSPSWAGSGSKGTTSGNFLKIGVNARAVAMGEAYSALADEASALYWNPAALTQTPSSSLTLMHASYLNDSSFEYGAFSHNMGRAGTLGLGVQYFSYGEIDTLNPDTLQKETFEPNDMALTVGYGLPLGPISAGVSVKHVKSKIQSSASTIAGDIGLLSSPLLNNRLRLAFTMMNLGGELKFHEEGASLPTTARMGSAFKISDRLMSTLDISLPKDNKAYAGIGAEFKIPTGNSFGLSLRGGYNSKTQSDIDGLTGFSMGMGFGMGSFGLDYGVVPFGDIGLAHRFSMTYAFGKAGDRQISELPQLAQAESTVKNSEPFKPELTFVQREKMSMMGKSLNGRPYLVQKGDTLGRIASKMYGSPQAWKKIYEANRHLLSDARNLEVGQNIVLP